MYESAYDAVTPYEAEMLLRGNSADFKRIYENMRHTLRRRKATLEKYGRQDTAGYERLKEALETTRGSQSAENFARLSNVLNQKMTKYTEQRKAEQRFKQRLKEKYDVDLTDAELREVMRRLNQATSTKQGRLKYQQGGLWESAIKSVKNKKSTANFIKSLGRG